MSSIRCAPLPSNGGDGEKPLLWGVRGGGEFPSLSSTPTAKAVMVQVGGVPGESLARNPTRGVQAASRFHTACRVKFP